MFQAHLQEKGFLVSDLKQELGMLQSVITEESGAWLKDCLVNILTCILSWEQEIENALEKCGVNIKLSNDGEFIVISHTLFIHSTFLLNHNSHYFFIQKFVV